MVLKITNKDKKFYEQHPIIRIATEEIEQEYEIIVAFKSKIFYQDEKNVFRFYSYFDFKNEKQYNEYIISIAFVINAIL